MSYGNEASLRPTREQNWRAFAREMGGAFHRGDLWGPDRLVLTIDRWTLRLFLDDSSGDVRTRIEVVSGPLPPSRWRLEYGEPGRGEPDPVVASPLLRRAILDARVLCVDVSPTGFVFEAAGVSPEVESLRQRLEIAVELLQMLAAIRKDEPEAGANRF